MAREKPNYRTELEQLNAAFPDKAYLSIKDVSAYTGKSINTVKKYFPFVKKTKEKPAGCTKVQLAQALG